MGAIEGVVNNNEITIVWNGIKIILPWSGWILFFTFLCYIYKNPEKLDEWLAKIDRFLLWLGFKRAKQFITRDVRTKIKQASKKINKEAEGLITKDVEIIWVNQDNIESFLRQGKVIIRMRHYQNQDKNIVNATTHYVLRGVLHTAKIYLPEKIQKAVNLALTKKILAEEQEVGTSTDYFFANILNPSLKSDKELEKIFMIIEKMERKGLFTRILLREIRLMGKKLYPATPTTQDFRETKSFFDFLDTFANIETGNFIRDWEFVRDNIKMGILFVAKIGKIAVEGYEPYIKRINEKINRGAKNIYLFGRKRNNINAIKEIARIIRAKNSKVKNFRIDKYKEISISEEVPAICIILKIT